MSVDTLADGTVIVETVVIPYEVDNNGENFAHIVNPPNNTHIWQIGMSSQDVVDIARAQGLKLKALCGKEWVPKLNPDKCDACKTCMDIAGELMRGMGE